MDKALQFSTQEVWKTGHLALIRGERKSTPYLTGFSAQALWFGLGEIPFGSVRAANGLSDHYKVAWLAGDLCSQSASQ